VAPPGLEWQENVVYGTAGATGRDLTLDLYKGRRGDGRPAVLFIHGGGWQAGFPLLFAHHAHALATEGFVAATMSYRFASEAPWPAALEDAKCAVRWLRAHAGELGVDPDRIAVAGGSAGGHLAAMVALTPGRYEGAGGWPDERSDVQAAVLLNPALDLRPTPGEAPNLRAAFVAFLGTDDPAVAAAASPMSCALAGAPPILTRVGSDDRSTPPATCEAFHAKLTEAGVENELQIVPGIGHGIPLADPAGCSAAALEFLDSRMRRL
jgi:acetyl esterase/lipase